MDKFTDLIQLEEEFGKIHLGFKNPPTDENFQPPDAKKADPLWQKLLEFLTFSPLKMVRFKEMIDQAQIDMEQEYEK
jgi:hypothetical protein